VNLFKPKFCNGQVLEVAGARLVLKTNARARRVSLRVDGARGEVIAVAPNERRLSEAVDFAHQRSAWIAERLKARPRGAPFAPGQAIPLRGELIRLEASGDAAAARFARDDEGRKIISGGEGEAFARRIERLLRAEAKKELQVRTDVHVAALGLKHAGVAVADPKSRWGSCTPSRGTIRYSWRLIMAPSWVLDYVAAHEVAHLVHADHSPRFWAVVKGLLGDEKAGRRWLRAHGATLHAVGRG
jgi:predicted metal-dependent hydrolase